MNAIRVIRAWSMPRGTVASILLALVFCCSVVAAQEAEESTDAGTSPAPADEPAAELADEPAAEPADEPAAELADEPAAEPADEPAAEPADASADGPVAAAVPVQSLTGRLELLVNPEYPPDQARLVYQPLVNYLNDATGLTIELTTDRNFHRYWLNARRGESADLIIEDAHMTAWRMGEFDYRPLVTTADPKTFSLITSGALADDELRDFIGRRISSLPSPSLGYLVLADWYDNPLQQPIILSTATSWLDAIEMVFSAEADAAIAPDNLAEKYPNLYPVATSSDFPGLTLSASPDVPDDARQALIDALTMLHDDPDHHAALFELDIDRFVPADPADYENLEQWLKPLFAF